MTDLPVQLRPVGPMAARLHQDLRREILSGALRPGEPLLELELAARFGTSRGPVREALAALANERLVESRNRRGTRVAIITLSEIQSEFEIRAALLGLASRLACTNGSDAAIRKIVEEVDCILALIEAKTVGGRLLEEGARLTRAILEAAGNAHVTDMVESAYRRAAWHYAQVGRDMPVYLDRVGACWREARAAFLVRDGLAADEAARESVHVVQAETLRRLVASEYAAAASRSERTAPRRATKQ